MESVQYHARSPNRQPVPPTATPTPRREERVESGRTSHLTSTWLLVREEGDVAKASQTYGCEISTLLRH